MSQIIDFSEKIESLVLEMVSRVTNARSKDSQGMANDLLAQYVGGLMYLVDSFSSVMDVDRSKLKANIDKLMNMELQ